MNNAPLFHDYYDGTCKTLTKRDESHWCDAEDFGFELADYMGFPYPEDYSDELVTLVADYLSTCYNDRYLLRKVYHFASK